MKKALTNSWNFFLGSSTSSIFQKNLPQKWCYIGIIISILISLGNTGYALKMAPGLSDESFYWYKIATQSFSNISFFSLYFRPFKDCSLFQLRSIMYIFISLSGVLWGSACYCYWKRKAGLTGLDCAVLILLGAGAYAIPHPHFPICPSYITINLVVGLLGGAFLVLSLHENKTINYLCTFASGAVLAQLLFIMPSNCILLPVIWGALLWVNYRKAFVFALGCISGMFLFWSTLLPFNAWVESFKTAVSETVNNSNLDQHGVKFLIKWTCKTLADLFLHNAFIIVALLFAIKIRIQTQNAVIATKGTLKIVSIALVLFCLAATILSIKTIASKCGGLPTLSIDILYSLAIALVMAQANKKNERQDFAFFIVFLFLPFALTFGTDLGFGGRASVYSVFLLSITYVLTRKEHAVFPNWIFAFLMALCCIGGLLQFRSKAWTCDERIIDANTMLYRNCGTHCSTNRLELYNNANEFLKETQYIYGDRYCWNFIMVLNKKPLADNAFRMNENNLIKLLQDKPNVLSQGVAVIESDEFFLNKETCEQLKSSCGIDVLQCPSLRIDNRWNFIILKKSNSFSPVLQK